LVVLIALVQSACVNDLSEDSEDSQDTELPYLAETRAADPGPGLRYMTWWASGDDIEEISDHANVAWPWVNINAPVEQMAADAVSYLERARALGMKVVVDVNGVFFRDDYTLKTPDEYWANWWVFQNAVRPYASSIAAFFVLDEPGNVYGYPWQWKDEPARSRRAQIKSDLEISSFIMKGTFPTIPIALNHSPWELWGDLRGYGAMLNPWNFDWISFDCYGRFRECGVGGEKGYAIPTYLARLKSRLRPGQRPFLIPDAWFHDGIPEWELYNRANDYYNLAKSDPSVVALVSFIWRHPEMQGASTSQWIADTWRGLGRQISHPIIEGAGSGCDDGHCIWITGQSFMPDSYVDIRLPGSNEIVAQYFDIDRDVASSPQVITLRLEEGLWGQFESGGLNVWVVNPARGNWSDGAYVRR